MQPQLQLEAGEVHLVQWIFVIFLFIVVIFLIVIIILFFLISRPWRCSLIDATVSSHGLVTDGSRNAARAKAFLLTDGAQWRLWSSRSRHFHHAFAPVTVR